MRTFNVADFIANDGLVILIGSYTERLNGCGLTITTIGMSPDISKREFYVYTFWLTRIPNGNGTYDTWLSCFAKTRLL